MEAATIKIIVNHHNNGCVSTSTQVQKNFLLLYSLLVAEEGRKIANRSRKYYLKFEKFSLKSFNSTRRRFCVHHSNKEQHRITFTFYFAYKLACEGALCDFFVNVNDCTIYLIYHDSSSAGNHNSLSCQ